MLLYQGVVHKLHTQVVQVRGKEWGRAYLQKFLWVAWEKVTIETVELPITLVLDPGDV